MEVNLSRWNQVYPNDKLYCDNTNEYGYYVGTSPEPTGDSISGETMSAKEGYKNKLYYPHTSSVLDGSKSCERYWFASSASYSSRYVLSVDCNGYV